jgi:hypothetical protein
VNLQPYAKGGENLQRNNFMLKKEGNHKTLNLIFSPGQEESPLSLRDFLLSLIAINCDACVFDKKNIKNVFFYVAYGQYPNVFFFIKKTNI